MCRKLPAHVILKCHNFARKGRQFVLLLYVTPILLQSISPQCRHRIKSALFPFKRGSIFEKKICIEVLTLEKCRMKNGGKQHPSILASIDAEESVLFSFV